MSPATQELPSSKQSSRDFEFPALANPGMRAGINLFSHADTGDLFTCWKRYLKAGFPMEPDCVTPVPP